MNRHSYCLILNLAVVIAVVIAFVPIAVVLSVPEMAVIVARISVICGLIISPIAYWALRDKDLYATVPLVLLAVAVSYLVLWPMSVLFKFPQTLLSVIILLLLAASAALTVAKRWGRKAYSDAEQPKKPRYCNILLSSLAISLAGSSGVHLWVLPSDNSATLWNLAVILDVVTWAAVGGCILAPLINAVWTIGRRNKGRPGSE